jgi:hypothetical protein
MSGPADASLHEPDSGTCGISPPNNDCSKAEPGGSPAQSQHPRRSTNRPAYGRRQPYGRRHRTARVCPRSSSAISFYGRFGTEVAFPSRWRAPRSIAGASEGYGSGGKCARFSCPRSRRRSASRTSSEALVDARLPFSKPLVPTRYSCQADRNPGPLAPNVIDAEETGGSGLKRRRKLARCSRPFSYG